MVRVMAVIYSVPHASVATAAGDIGAKAIADALAMHDPGPVLVPRRNGVPIPRTEDDDYNRRTTRWDELVQKLEEHPEAKLVDVHTYGRSLPPEWNLSGDPVLVVMVLPGQQQRDLYNTYFGAFPWVAGSAENRNVGLATARGLLLEFNSGALTMPGWQVAQEAVSAFIRQEDQDKPADQYRPGHKRDWVW
jgi:hypothetical protein